MQHNGLLNRTNETSKKKPQMLNETNVENALFIEFVGIRDLFVRVVWRNLYLLNKIYKRILPELPDYTQESKNEPI